jgi:signal transduction histidine kinase
MRPKLLLIVLVLVIVPTAILSLMASRALRVQELILQRRMETAAVSAARDVSSRVGMSIDGDLDRVCVAISDCLAHGGSLAEIGAAETRLQKSAASVKHIYVFMNPWGFIYPDGIEGKGNEKEQASKGTDISASSSPPDDLLAALRRGIASAGMANESLKFTCNNASYCFAALRNNKGLYAGYEIDRQKFSDGLAVMIEPVAKEGLVFVAEGPDFVITAPPHLARGGVVISDTLQPESGENVTAVDLAREESRMSTKEDVGPLLISRLPPPFDYVRITAFLKKTGESRQSAVSQARLYGWGVLLLALVIVIGTWAVMHEAILESRLARARSDFVIGVSHDLRTPLSAMKVLAETLYLDRVSDPAKRKEFLGAIVGESERLSQLVERVLFFVRFGQDALAYRHVGTDVGALVTSVLDIFCARFTATVAPEIHVDVRPDLPTVKLDPGAMTQVMLNLLDNACKYGRRQRSEIRGQRSEIGDRTAEGKNDAVKPSPSTLISVSVGLVRRRTNWMWREKEWIEISVRDYGIGIEKKELKRIFHRFYRVPGAQEENVSGVGLGLALCRHIVRAHGGRVEVESSPGKGSTFSVLLPVVPDGSMIQDS